MSTVHELLDTIRDRAYRAITSSRGDALAPVRVPKDLARRLNAALGRPLASRDELRNRAAARARLEELRRGAANAVDVRSAPRDDAPVLVYCEADRNARLLARIEEVLEAKGIRWKRLDVSGDEATIDFVTRKAGCERDELPVVFVADHPVGGYEALVRADVTGELERLVRGTGSQADQRS